MLCEDEVRQVASQKATQITLGLIVSHTKEVTRELREERNEARADYRRMLSVAEKLKEENKRLREQLELILSDTQVQDMEKYASALHVIRERVEEVLKGE